MAVGDVRLGPVDDVLVAVADGAGLDPGYVGAGVRFGDAEAEDLLAANRRRGPLLLLLFGAEREDRGHRHVGLHREAHGQASAVGVDDLLGEHEARVVVAALAAVRDGLIEAEKAELAHAGEHPVRESVLLPLLGVGLELLDDEAPDRLAQLLVLVGEDEVLARGGEVRLEDVSGGHGFGLSSGRAAPAGR